MKDPERIAVEPEILDSTSTAQKVIRKVLKLASHIPFARNGLSMAFALQDPHVPATKKAIILGALLYFLSPIDLIPDFIPVIGQADDAAVVMAAFRQVRDIITPAHLERADALLEKYKKG